MINRVKKKIHDLRQRPEEERLKAATKFTIIAGIAIVILWLAVFLPLQLSLGKPDTTAPPEEEIKNIITGTESPSPTPVVSSTPLSAPLLITPSPTPSAEPESIQLLPASENTPSPTPTPKR